jgi:hypothetical protein
MSRPLLDATADYNTKMVEFVLQIYLASIRATHNLNLLKDVAESS